MNQQNKDIPIIKTFTHNGEFYVYDTKINRLFGISKSDIANTTSKTSVNKSDEEVE